MRRGWVLAAALIATSAVVASFTYLGRETPSSPLAPPTPQTLAGALPGGGGAAIATAPAQPQLREVDRLIDAYTDQTAEAPSALGYTFLGQLELQRARLTGDVASFARAEDALTRAVELSPTDPEPAALLANVRFTTHDFVGAYELATRIHERTSDLGALAVRGDAALELGRYDEAAQHYSTLSQNLPGVSTSLVRMSRLVWLRGDAERAAELAAEAERAAIAEGAFGATRAWYAVYRSSLALQAGDYDAATVHARRAVRLAPDYHPAIAALGAAHAARGEFTNAIQRYEHAASIVPEPASLIALGDLYTAQGRDELAADRYATVEAIAKLAEVNRRLYDRELALFYAEQGKELSSALAAAERSIAIRKDVYGYDVLAWVRFRLGDLEGARKASDRAIALGTPDARLWFHAGMISAELGDEERARAELDRALDLHPAFDPLLAPVARDTLAELGGA